MTFGDYLKKLREEKGFGIRELARLSGQDPAYIHRLESGAKVSPSADVLKTIVRSLKVSERRQRVLSLLADQGEVDAALVSLVLRKEEILMVDFESAAKASFRGNRPKTEEQWEKFIDGIRQARESFERG